jgi:hypothetical protein
MYKKILAAVNEFTNSESAARYAIAFHNHVRRNYALSSLPKRELTRIHSNKLSLPSKGSLLRLMVVGLTWRASSKEVTHFRNFRTWYIKIMWILYLLQQEEKMYQNDFL